jgi:hypothetical protein
MPYVIEQTVSPSPVKANDRVAQKGLMISSHDFSKSG